jgi:myo-inositol-1(or 4)-monophosphatase
MAYEVELDFAKELAKTAGEMTRKAFGLQTSATWKSDSTPLTETDMAINQFVIEKVQKKFPDDGVLGEEASYESKRQRLWVVDPIDGTMPFTLGAPLSTFCLSLVIDGQPVLGIIHDPYLERMFWAAKGQGAFVNDTPLHVSDAKDVARSYITLSTRMGEDRKSVGEIFDEIDKLDCKVFNFRSFAYGSCFVAAGTAVAAVIGRPKPWDVAATKIIVEEAGGKVTDVAGKERRYDADGDGLLATNGHVHERLLEIFNS